MPGSSEDPTRREELEKWITEPNSKFIIQKYGKLYILSECDQASRCLLVSLTSYQLRLQESEPRQPKRYHFDRNRSGSMGPSGLILRRLR